MALTVSYRKHLTVAALLVLVLIVSHLAAWMLPAVFVPLQAQALDRLFGLRTMLERDPYYDDTVILVTIDDFSVEAEDDYYRGRFQQGELVEALARAGIAAQFHDMIFAAPIDEEADGALIEATANAGHVYYGMALGASLENRGFSEGARRREGTERVIDRQRWYPRVSGDVSRIYEATRHFVTFPELADASQGIGFIDMVPDQDGVHRRVAMLIRDGDGFLPSLPLLVVSEYLGVTPDRIDVEPGRAVTLRGARRPGSETGDIAIPIDENGRMLVNFLGRWGKIETYPYSAIHEAAGDRYAMEDLRDLLEGKIAVVTWMTTGSGDLGAIPLETSFPLGAVHATAMHNILTADFLRELSTWQMLALINLPLLVLLFVGALRLSTIPFLLLEVGLIVGYVALAGLLFTTRGWILDVPVPLHFLVISAVTVAAYQFHVESKARTRLDRELAVAREIQLAALPSEMPEFAGYDVAGTSRPADETGGDVFDLIPLDERRMMLLLGDATGHGLGPALNVTQVRAMLRVALRLGADLDAAYTHINDQLAQDLPDNRFVTGFLGVIDRETHRLVYHSGGQGPLLHFHQATGECEWRGATSTPMGMIAGLPLAPPREFVLEPGDVIGLMTDGVFEYENPAEEQYGQERVEALVRERHAKPMSAMVDTLLEQVTRFAGAAPQGDDVTILFLRRLP